MFSGPRTQNIDNGERNTNGGGVNIDARYLYSSRIRWKDNGTFSNNAAIKYKVTDLNNGYEYYSGTLTPNYGPDYGPGSQGEGLYLNLEFSGFGWRQGFPGDENIAANSTIRVSYWEDTYFPQPDYFDLQLMDDGELTNITEQDGTRRYHQIFTHGFPIGGEVPGDGFDDANFRNDNFTLNPQMKDLVVEIDMSPGITLWDYSANILSRLQAIFAEIGINLIVKWDYLGNDRFADYGSDLNFAEAVDCLVQERDISRLGRNALHVVVSELPPASGWNPNLYGINVTMVGNINSWQSASESEALARQHASEYALDSVGCIIFWKNFETDLQRDGGGGIPWPLTEAFCWTTAHEMGHALGIWKPKEYSGNREIMSHRVGFDQDSYQDVYMHFDYRNYQGMAHNDNPYDLPSNCICTRDVLGIQTVSIISGWGL